MNDVLLDPSANPLLGEGLKLDKLNAGSEGPGNGEALITIGLDADETRVTEVTVGNLALDSDGDADDDEVSDSDNGPGEEGQDQEEPSQDGGNVLPVPGCGDVLPVQCGNNKADFHVAKFARGSRGACIQYKDEWLTPNEFQFISGRESCKDWKRSIRHDGRPMKRLVAQGQVRVHKIDCLCKLCQTSPAPTNLRVKEEKRRRLNPGFIPAVKLSPSALQNGRSLEEPTAPLKTSRRAGQNRSWTVSPQGVTTTRDSDSDGSRPVGKTLYLSDTSPQPHEQAGDPEWRPSGSHDPPKKRRKMPASQQFKSEGKSTTSPLVTKKELELPMSRGQLVGNASPPRPEEVMTWSVSDVVQFVSAQGFVLYAHRFKEEDVDGEALLDIREEHLIDRIQMRLGPALRLYRLIRQIQCP